MTYWLVPCNTKYYDVFGAFEKNEILDWKQSNQMADHPNALEKSTYLHEQY